MRRSEDEAKEIKFWARVYKTNTCWFWIGATNGAYGMTPWNVSAHRYSWEMFYGPIPATLFVLHTCDIKKCVNPSHLFLGTQKDNMQDAAKKGRLFLQNNVMPQETRNLISIAMLKNKNARRHHNAEEIANGC